MVIVPPSADPVKDPIFLVLSYEPCRLSSG